MNRQSLILDDTAISAIEQAPPRVQGALWGEAIRSTRRSHIARISECNYTDIGASNAANRQLITAGRSGM